VSTLVATPAQQAMNLQYRPTLFDVGAAVRAYVTGDLDAQGLARELSLHGLSDARQTALFWQHARGLDLADIRTLQATGIFAEADVATWRARLGHDGTVSSFMTQAEDMRPARDACLLTARHYATEYLTGRITRTQLEGAINSVRHTLNGAPLLTDGEVTNLLALPEVVGGAARKHVSLNMLTRSYEDGLITLNEFSDAATALGYSADDVRLLEQELLVAAKRAQERAAKAAVSAARGLFAKLSVAQMKTAYTEGIMTLEQVRAELAARQYAQSAIDTIATEFLIAAGLAPKQPPTA
jgi:hypothetical protein